MGYIPPDLAVASKDLNMEPLSRRNFIQAFTLGAACGYKSLFAQQTPGKDVSWLAAIQQPPANLPANAPRLSELRAPTLEAWKTRRDELRRWWLELLGPMPADRKA